jgi:hypothetical protein
MMQTPICLRCSYPRRERTSLASRWRSSKVSPQRFERYFIEITTDLLASYDLPAQIAQIEDMIAQGVEMQVVLRLLCLASILGGGIKAKALENIKREFLQAYGYHHLPMLLALAAPPLSALLPSPLPAGAPASAAAHAKWPYAQVRKQLRLLIDADGLDELENDASYVYSGFAPLSARLVQAVAQKGGVLANPAEAGGAPRVRAHPIVGWKGFDDVVALVPGETVDVVQTLADTTGAAISEPSIPSAMPVPILTPYRTQCSSRRRETRRPSCSSLADAPTRRSPHCGGLRGRTAVSRHHGAARFRTC